MTDYSKKLKELILTTIKEGASDLHLTVGRHPTIRIAGELIPLVNEPVLTPSDTEGLIKTFLNDDEEKSLKENKEIDLSYAHEDKTRFRVNAFYQRGFLGAALRNIPTSIKTLKELNLPEILTEFADRKQGFFLVVGPIGQGKSTTLASMIDHINRTKSKHIITVEDPVEYIFTQDKSIVDQREVRYDTMSFGSAMRSMFRQDINVALIGEMRDVETISTAVTAAETGHLIFSTLHTNNAAQTIDRIIDSFPPNQQNQIRAQLASVLLGVFSQRLVSRISGGRIPAYELMLNNSAVRTLIREGRTHELDMVIETGYEQGMISLNRSLAELVRAGEINMKDALNQSLNPRGLEALT
ncbi:MAG: type IV pili twitching motility protein PilT [Candidatus Terrybacteria bacterium CG10_big_fil_rev_8_21_14_0_10_41_10]|uniref:Type IV pili twitching motility protein PilT n=1 Tax=Candidatus Terrybacteria bacterium CG10_big_fil_rev_8_21_14_0_10_41_10 TaxID=1975026 RepID=A0A2M8LAU7_9BACT|nr:MAG: type IV pili twitching motility protein PilT [Candidatus Terrybacteria bacterium CG10_big_fil_rev_8_21_14_0_10_41_10]